MASPKVGIIGIGLIGGSIALGLRKSGWASEIIGIDTNTEHQKKALSLRLVDRIATWQEAIDQVDVFVCAIPVDLLVALIPSVLDALKPGQVIIEVGSTKTPVFEALKNHPYLKYKQINAIIQYRKQHGNYSGIADLKKVLILSPQTIEQLTPYLQF